MVVYTDTSVIGGCFDAEFKEWSISIISDFKKGTKTMMISDITLQELSFAKKEVQNILENIPNENIIKVLANEKIISLAENYIVEGALTKKSFNDALHIATASINNADVLASWNFKHIVNLNRIRLFNSVNLKLGYKLIEIRTPRELLWKQNQSLKKN